MTEENQPTMSEEEIKEFGLSLAEGYLEHRGYQASRCGSWSCDCEEPLLVAEDNGQAVLVSIRACLGPDAAAIPQLELAPEDFAAMRRACLLYAADHEDVSSVRHDAISIAIVGERHARLRHLVGAWTWEEDED